MQVNMNVVITTLQGDAVEEKGESITAARVAVVALLTSGKTGDERYKNYAMAQKIVADETNVDLKAEDITRIKGAVGECYGPLVVGRVWDLLGEGDTK